MAKRATAAALRMDGEKQFLKLFGTLANSTSTWQAWEDLMTVMACSISNAVDRTPEKFEKREAEYEKSIARLGGRDTPAEIFALITAELEKNPHQDFLGKLYMALNLGNHWRGQFFTPYHISDFMAKLTIGEETKAEIVKQGYVFANDSCVGAGGMLIAVANAMRDEGINYQTDALFVGQDIDRVVAIMAYIQMSLLGCPGYVIVGDSLTNPPGFHPLFPQDSEDLELWITPMFLLPVWEARRLEVLIAEQKKKMEGEGEPLLLPDRRKEMEERQLQATDAAEMQAAAQDTGMPPGEAKGNVVDLNAGRTLESPYATAYKTDDDTAADDEYGAGILWGSCQDGAEAADSIAGCPAPAEDAGAHIKETVNPQGDTKTAGIAQQIPPSPDAMEEESYETSWGGTGDGDYETSWGVASEQIPAPTPMTEAELKEAACAKLASELDKAKDKNFADPVIGYLVKRCREDRGLAEDVLQAHKTWEKCLDYLYAQAKEYVPDKSARCAAVPDPTVYEWSEDYYHKDDKAEEEQKEKEAEERKRQAKERAEKAKKAGTKKASGKRKPKATQKKDTPDTGKAGAGNPEQKTAAADSMASEAGTMGVGKPDASLKPQEAGAGGSVSASELPSQDSGGMEGQMDMFSMLAGKPA